jgi:hypothetical protein
VHLIKQSRQADPAGEKSGEQEVALLRHVVGEQHGDLPGPLGCRAEVALRGTGEVLVLGDHLADQVGQVVVTFSGSTVNGLLRHRVGEHVIDEVGDRQLGRGRSRGAPAAAARTTAATRLRRFSLSVRWRASTASRASATERHSGFLLFRPTRAVAGNFGAGL